MSISDLTQKLASLFCSSATNDTSDESDTSAHIEEPHYVQFHHLEHGAVHDDGTQKLNRFSSTLTNSHDFPGAQVSQSLAAMLVLTLR